MSAHSFSAISDSRNTPGRSPSAAMSINQKPSSIDIDERDHSDHEVDRRRWATTEFENRMGPHFQAMVHALAGKDWKTRVSMSCLRLSSTNTPEGEVGGPGTGIRHIYSRLCLDIEHEQWPIWYKPHVTLMYACKLASYEPLWRAKFRCQALLQQREVTLWINGNTKGSLLLDSNCELHTLCRMMQEIITQEFNVAEPDHPLHIGWGIHL